MHHIRKSKVDRKEARAIVILLTVLYVLLALFLPRQVASAAQAEPWSFGMMSAETKSKLYSVDKQTGYDGTVTEIVYEDTPSEGNCYAIVSVSIAKNDITAGSIDIDEIKLNIEGKSFDPVSPGWSFLQRHGYPIFSSNSISSSGNGFIAFEVPAHYLDEDCSGWYVSWNGIASPEYSSDMNDTPYNDGIVATQSSIDRGILSAYEEQGGATLNDPFFVLNPYGNAPLTGIAIFETDDQSSVSVTVHGKDAASDITYSVEGGSAHHEIPIYGLYADSENRVTISSGGVSKTILISTDKLPDNILQVTRVAGDSSHQEAGQLYLLQSPYQIAFDVNGDVRWYLTEEWSTVDCSYSFSFDKDGSGFWASRNPLTGSIYNWGCEIFHMTWTGRVDVLYSGAEDTQVHHAGCLGPEGEYLYFASNRIYSLNPETGVSSLFLDLDEFIDPSQGAINVETGGSTTDSWHPNSIEYLPEDDSLLLSYRNQQMILKIDFTTREIKWVFTCASGLDEEGNSWTRLSCDADKIILPDDGDADFEWFYDQHDSNVISYDAQSGIMLLALFDNGTNRYNYGDYPNDAKYSRMVVYEINENTARARQVFEYGEERGTELHSQWYGSTRYIANNDHYVGCFRMHDGTTNSHVIETDSSGSVVAEYEIGLASYGVYRAYPINLASSYVPELGLGSSDGVERHVYSPNRWSRLQEEGSYQQVDVTLTQLSREADTVSVTGILDIPDSNIMVNPKLVVRGSLGVYEFNLINALESSGLFYGRGVDLSSLPDDVYSLSIVAQTSDGTFYEAYTNRELRVGGGAAADIEISESVPGFEQQNQLRELLLQAQMHTFEDAAVIQDPFGVSPLTAALCFSTDSLSSVQVVVHGKTSDADIKYEISGQRRLHIITIWGLYYNDTTEATVTCVDASGHAQQKSLSITTGEAPDLSRMPQISCSYDEGRSSEIAPGLTFCATIGSYHLAVDKYGDVRWYYSDPAGLGDSGITFNDQQHLLVLTPKSSSAATNSFSLMEMDLMGRKYGEYFIDGSFHHEAKLMENGHILCAASGQGKSTINDRIVELDPDTGDVVREWNIDEILTQYGVDLLADPVWGYVPLSTEDGSEFNANWFHNNCIFYNDKDDSFILSSCHRSMVIKINASTQEVIWILGDHALLEDTGLEPYLLTPVDADGKEVSNDSFEWQYAQHAPTVMRNGDLLLFDNGDHRSRYAEFAVPATENYSRMVRYHIDEDAMTVSQVWEFGEQLGSEHYCTYVGDADQLGEDHYLGTFGGHFVDSDGNASDAMSGINTAALFEVVGDDVIWRLDTTPNEPIRSSGIYRSERVELNVITYSYDMLSGVMWYGNTVGSPEQTEIDPSAYAFGNTGISITSLHNEGNRINIEGSVIEEEQPKSAYVLVVDSSGSHCYAASVSDEGLVSASIVRPLDSLWDSVDLYILVLKDDGSQIKESLSVDISGAGAFSLEIEGDARMSAGDSQSLLASFSPKVVADETVEWASSDSTIIDVDQSGVATAKMAGTAVITASARSGGAAASITIDVTGLSIERNELTLRLGDQYTLQASALWDEESNNDITWSSSDANVATVDENGLVVPQEKGTTNITASSNGHTVTCCVTIQPRIDEGVYAITSCLPGAKSLDIASGSSLGGANVQIWDANHTLAQQFYFSYVGNGEYVISPQCSRDMALDVQYADTADGTNVWQYEGNNTAAQRWYLQDCGDNSFNFVSVATGKYLDVSNAQTASGTNVQIWSGNGTLAQKFRVTQLFHDGVYAIEPRCAPGYRLDISGGSADDGANVQIWESNGTAAQSFIIRNEGAGEYSIASVSSGKMIDLFNAENHDGANVVQWTPNNTPAQRWRIQFEDDGTFSFVSCSSGRYLDVASAGLGNGVNVHTWAGNDTNAQRFVLHDVSAQFMLEPALDSAYALDISNASTDDGAAVQLWLKNGTSAQIFTVWGRNPGIILNVGSSKSLDVTNGWIDNGTPIQQFRYNATMSQKWYLEYAGNGLYRIVSANSGKCLDVPNALVFEGARLQLFERNNTEAQLFRLVPIEGGE